MKVTTNIVVTLFLVVSLKVAAGEAGTPGLAITKVLNPERNELVDIYYWYPSKAADPDFVFGGNKAFKGTVASLDAKVADGKFPIILLAIGGLRSSPFHSGWIASALARQGFVVAVPQPPAARRLKPDMAAEEPWLRPGDLSLSLTYLKNNSPLKDSVRTDKVYGVGFFLGGTSMLALAGAEFDPGLYRSSCKHDGVNMDCRWFRKNGVDLEKVSYHEPDRSMQDPRIESVVAIDPELTKTFGATSLRRLPVMVSIIDIRENRDKYPGFDLPDSIRSNPEIAISRIRKSNIFSAFGVCTPEGRAMFAARDENICKDPEGIERRDVHRLIIDRILASLDDRKDFDANSAGAKRRAADSRR
ncbi:MAG: hypothetical protein PVI79_02225 [Gammaproteobacteria bacterium]|jgi:predicted dienelactone hydrolase